MKTPKSLAKSGTITDLLFTLQEPFSLNRTFLPPTNYPQRLTFQPFNFPIQISSTISLSSPFSGWWSPPLEYIIRTKEGLHGPFHQLSGLIKINTLTNFGYLSPKFLCHISSSFEEDTPQTLPPTTHHSWEVNVVRFNLIGKKEAQLSSSKVCS